MGQMIQKRGQAQPPDGYREGQSPHHGACYWSNLVPPKCHASPLSWTRCQDTLREAAFTRLIAVSTQTATEPTTDSFVRWQNFQIWECNLRYLRSWSVTKKKSGQPHRWRLVSVFCVISNNMKLWPTVWEMIEESVESHCDLICAKCRQPPFALWPLGKTCFPHSERPHWERGKSACQEAGRRFFQLTELVCLRKWIAIRVIRAINNVFGHFSRFPKWSNTQKNIKEVWFTFGFTTVCCTNIAYRKIAVPAPVSGHALFQLFGAPGPASCSLWVLAGNMQ